jgi:hypothetical protein
VASERYPLHAAERLRSAQRARAEHVWLEAQAECARAGADVAHAERLLAEHAAEQLEMPTVPASTSALELQRAAAFAQRRAAQARVLRERLSAARARAGEHERALREAQHALAEARSGERLLEQDRARFEGALRREREQAEQVEIDEQVEQSRIEQTRKDRGR